VLNLFEPILPTKRELLVRLKRANPDLSIVWLLPVALHPLSWAAVALQKLLRPRRPALNPAQVFARLRYDTSGIARLAPEIRAQASRIARNGQPIQTVSADQTDSFAPVLAADRQFA